VLSQDRPNGSNSIPMTAGRATVASQADRCKWMAMTSIVRVSKIVTMDWYRLLIEDCDALITEGVFQSRWFLIEAYHGLGKRILEERENFEQAGIQEPGMVQQVAESLNKSERTIYYAIQFARQYPTLDVLPGGKNISWHKIVNNLLAPPKGHLHSEYPTTYYAGLGTGYWSKTDSRWHIILPQGTTLEIDQGVEGLVTFKERG